MDERTAREIADCATGDVRALYAEIERLSRIQLRAIEWIGELETALGFSPTAAVAGYEQEILAAINRLVAERDIWHGRLLLLASASNHATFRHGFGCRHEGYTVYDFTDGCTCDAVERYEALRGALRGCCAEPEIDQEGK